jgi:hypothetical protein
MYRVGYIILALVNITQWRQDDNLYRYRDIETNKLEKDIRSFALYVKIPLSLSLPKTKLIIPKKG